MRTTAFLVMMHWLALGLSAQYPLPVIKAGSPDAKTRIGTDEPKDWYISPHLRPDVFISNRVGETVTFYTDMDSISFSISSVWEYDFVILLNDTDSAFTRVKYAKSYLDILKEAREYDDNDQREINPYSYKRPDDPELMRIRNKYNLDSVVGSGNEVSKIIRLLLWVSQSFKHDGTKETPSYASMTDLMAHCYLKSENTLHCAAMAWVLVDCYLSMGFDARQVVCYPKDSTDHECHSTVVVFSKQLDKWLFMDPTNGAYVMNDRQEILSLEEFRMALIEDRDIRINEEAKNKSDFMQEGYLGWYMPKNLYAFQCYSVTDSAITSNVLLPVEYVGEFTHTRQYRPTITYNPAVFWKKPGE